MLNVGHWRAWHPNSVIASHEAWGVEVQEVRKNEVSVKRERIIYIIYAPANHILPIFLKFVWSAFFSMMR